MSRTLSRLREVTGDPILVRAGRNMVLTPWAEATRERARGAVYEARAVLQPSTETLKVENLERLFTIRANDGFVVAFGPLLIAAVAEAAPDVCIRFSPKPEKTSRYLCRATWDLKYACSDYFRIGSLPRYVRDIRWRHTPRSAFTIMFPGATWLPHPTGRYTALSTMRWLKWG